MRESKTALHCLSKKQESAPKITIVTIALNACSSIEETILSVINAKNRFIQYIVVDGGSKDGTMEVINRYKDKIDIIVSEPDRGIYDAMNKGIALSTGDVIGLLNSGDVYENDALDAVAEAVNKHGKNAIYFGNAFLFYIDLGKKRLVQAKMPNLTRSMSICHQAVFIPRSVYARFGAYSLEYKYASDFHYLLNLYLRKERFVHIDCPLVTFRTGGLSDTKILSSRLETIRILFQLGSPERFKGALLYIYEIGQMYIYRGLVKALGKGVAASLRLKLSRSTGVSPPKNERI